MRAARGGAKQLYFVYADFVTRSLCDTLSSQRWHLTAGGNWPGGALVTQFLTGFQERTHDFPCTRVPPLIHLRAINNDNNINNVDVGGAEDNDGGERTFSPGSFDRVRTYVRTYVFHRHSFPLSLPSLQLLVRWTWAYVRSFEAWIVAHQSCHFIFFSIYDRWYDRETREMERSRWIHVGKKIRSWDGDKSHGWCTVTRK